MATELEDIVRILRDELRCGISDEMAASCKSPLDIVRDVINRLNEGILRLFSERAKYTVNRANYGAMHPEHSQNDRELLGQPNKIALYSCYMPCLQEICEEGDNSRADFEKCLAIDRELMPLVHQRVWCGKAVAMYKGLREMATDVPEREAGILHEMANIAEKNGYNMDAEKVARLFQRIMELNKGVQRAYRRIGAESGVGSGYSTISSTLVGPESLIENTKSYLLGMARIQHPGEQLVARHRNDKDGRGYLVEVIRV